MKKTLRLTSSILTGAAISVMAQAPVWANATQITGVNVAQTNQGFNVVLTTDKGDRPQVFLINQGNNLVGEIINTQLRLPNGNSYRQANPAPGISAVEVTQSDTATVRVVITGQGSAPTGRIIQGEGESILLSVDRASGDNASAPPPVRVPRPAPPVAQTPPGDPSNVLPPSVPAPRVINNSSPDVLIPNPNVKIDGLPPLPGTVPPPSNPAPTFQPRAVPPPLGDITMSNIDPSPSVINLGTTQVIPRLVLRDAPVREALTLLARTAGWNIAFTHDDGSQGIQGQSAGKNDSSNDMGPKISLDIENEPVQNVFNYVLRISGLQANVIGKTIFVGKKLPLDSRNIVMRTLRLNQAKASEVANYLSSQGANTQLPVTRIRIEQVGQGLNSRVIENREPAIIALGATEGDGPLVLRGLSVITDERLNSITLVGDPRKVEIAISMLTQMDLRRRQVAVNVKVIDINLAGENNYNSSFSFGINKSFFVNDGGAASVNFGGINPPDSETVRNGITNPPTVPNPFYDGATPGLLPRLDRDGVQIVPLTAPGGGVFLRPISPITDRIDKSAVDQATFEPFSRDPDTGAITGTGEATFRLFPFFQYPKQFLSLLQAQIVNRQAKILTDPTLVVQEGEQAQVDLTEQIVSNIKVERTTSGNTTTATTSVEKDVAGLVLKIVVDRIDDNGFISLRVNPAIKSIGRTQTINIEGGGSNQIQLLQTRELQSGLIRLRDSQTLIVSGIIADRERLEASKIPILGDLPILGSLFRKTNKINERAEVIVMLTPEILDDGDRSNFGYQYNPSPDARQLIQRSGQPVPYR